MNEEFFGRLDEAIEVANEHRDNLLAFPGVVALVAPDIHTTFPRTASWIPLSLETVMRRPISSTLPCPTSTVRGR